MPDFSFSEYIFEKRFKWNTHWLKYEKIAMGWKQMPVVYPLMNDDLQAVCQKTKKRGELSSPLFSDSVFICQRQHLTPFSMRRRFEN